MPTGVAAAVHPRKVGVGHRLPIDGVEEPIFRGGVQVGTRRRYSEGLLRTVLKRLDQRMGAGLSQEDRIRRAHEAARAAGGRFDDEDPATLEQIDAALLKAIAGRSRLRDEEQKLLARPHEGAAPMAGRSCSQHDLKGAGRLSPDHSDDGSAQPNPIDDDRQVGRAPQHDLNSTGCCSPDDGFTPMTWPDDEDSA